MLVGGGGKDGEQVPLFNRSLGRAHRVVVIGAGFAGIGAALELQRLGVEVVVLEVSWERAGVWKEAAGGVGGGDVRAERGGKGRGGARRVHWSLRHVALYVRV